MPPRRSDDSHLISLLRQIFGARPSESAVRVPDSSRLDPVYFQDIRDTPDPTLTLDLLRQIDWKLFEEVCAAYFRCLDFHAVTQSHGPDGGIDITLSHADAPEKVVGLVQCKQWAAPVGPKPVRELLGVMVDARVAEGIFITSSTFHVEAQVFAASNKIDLIDGERLLHLIRKLSPADQERLLAVATRGDYLTPSCAACGVKLVRRTGRQGNGFWGCANYPRCRVTMDR